MSEHNLDDYNYERINCTGCGEDTNHVPPDLPKEWDGYCPRCAITKMQKGELPKPDPTALIQQVMGKMADILGVTVLVQKMGEDTECIASDEGGAWFSTRLSMN